MSRPFIPTDVDLMIKELSSIIPESKPMDIIRIALFKLKEEYILKPKVSLSNPKHPFYSKATPEEELGIAESMKDLETGNFKRIKPDEDILTSIFK
jgi:hypothetical protein